MTEKIGPGPAVKARPSIHLFARRTKMPPKFSEMKVLSDSDRRKMQKQRDAEKKQQDEILSQKSQTMKIVSISVIALVIVIIVAVFFTVSSERTSKQQEKESRQVEIKFPSGEIFKFDGRTKVWEKPTRTKIEEGEGVRTGKAGSITMIFSKNRSIRLGENSEMMFNRISTIDDKPDALDIDTSMSKGSAILEIMPGPGSLSIDCQHLAVKMPTGLGANFKIVYGKKDGVENVRVAVKSGRVQVQNKKTKAMYDVEGLHEFFIDAKNQVTGPARFSASSEVF